MSIWNKVTYVCSGGALIVVVFPAFNQLYPCDGAGMLPAAEILLEVKYIPCRTGHIQFLGVYDSFHDRSFRLAVKLGNFFLI